MKHTKTLFAGLSVLAIGASLVGCSAETGGAGGDTYEVVVLASSSQNGYNQAVYEGVERKAKELSEDLGVTIKTKIQDGQFDANTQLSQLQNAGTSGGTDGIIVVPHDGPALAAAFPLANPKPVAAVLNPIGPEISEMQPQVDGVVTTVASPPANGAKLQAETVVEYCKDIDPCKIGYLAGLLNSPLDVERVAAWDAVIEKHKNITVVGTLEGAYDRDKSLTAVSNLLQANPDLNGILSNADQQTMGAQIALENAGIDPSTVFLTGGGGTTEGVQAVRDGKWTNDFLNYPVSMGEAALEQIMNSILGNEVEVVVDADSLVAVGPIADRAVLDAAPDFTGEWNG
ncbi:Ribose import binding protein RbsB [Leucobacter aridicollis]|uniref:sugar ABC transporter substrate-binding protein n=1 Tax=Leucobacter aridicollis TaxID=283878 RepID=UPI000EB01309|nr:sugar ABC transporter substrate-binding protein [Leucobacter aridicollis]MCS3429132.1 ribose transport system substrate-binding protein [Leucobacter aridicollis]RKQ85732.1 ribose transport system substrate-binding protein [Mycolicibacterium mucogenicum 261Sha1.1M5]